MTCDHVREQLTAYLDGDLDPDRGTVVRGHLRTCDACRKVSEQEAALRDGLRALPTVDPPNHLWANIQAQLAETEIAESKRPAWKRALARWTPALPRFAMVGALAAAAIAILWWRTRPDDAPAQQLAVTNVPPQVLQPSQERTALTTPCNLDSPDSDVTADLEAEAARITACYAQTSNELLALANEARANLTDEQRATYDAAIVALEQAVDRAADGRSKQRAYRAMNRYLQNLLTRDEVALASAL
jgi:hypothetical protein